MSPWKEGLWPGCFSAGSVYPHLSRAPVGVHTGHAGSIRALGLLCQLWHRGQQQVWALHKGSPCWCFPSPAQLHRVSQEPVLGQWVQECQGIGSWEHSQKIPLFSLTTALRYTVLSWWWLGESMGASGCGYTSSSPQPSWHLTRSQPEHLGDVEKIRAFLLLSIPALQWGAGIGTQASWASHPTVLSQASAAAFMPSRRASRRLLHHLPSPTAFWCPPDFSTLSTKQTPSLCMPLLAGHGIRHLGRHRGEQLCCKGQWGMGQTPQAELESVSSCAWDYERKRLV